MRSDRRKSAECAGPEPAQPDYGFNAPAAPAYQQNDVPASAGFDVDLPPVVEEPPARRDTLDVPDFLK